MDFVFHAHSVKNGMDNHVFAPLEKGNKMELVLINAHLDN